MIGYRKATGDYIEVPAGTPVSPTCVPVALRPSRNHVWTDAWATAPLDPAVCWRLKTSAELATSKDTELQDFLDSAGGKVAKALATVLIQKGVCTLAELRTIYRGL